jgi:hypothetical protein
MQNKLLSKNPDAIKILKMFYEANTIFLISDFTSQKMQNFGIQKNWPLSSDAARTKVKKVLNIPRSEENGFCIKKNLKRE